MGKPDLKAIVIKTLGDFVEMDHHIKVRLAEEVVKAYEHFHGDKNQRVLKKVMRFFYEHPIHHFSFKEIMEYTGEEAIQVRTALGFLLIDENLVVYHHPENTTDTHFKRNPIFPIEILKGDE